MNPKDGIEHPIVRYNYIERHVWEKFIKSCSSYYFLVSSNLIFKRIILCVLYMLIIFRYNHVKEYFHYAYNRLKVNHVRKIRKINKYHNRLSRGGYKKLKECRINEKNGEMTQ